jgi:inner membrane protein
MERNRPLRAIITGKVTTEVGEAAKTEIKSISFDDEEAIPQLEEL